MNNLNMNLPNLISMTRLLLSPFVLFLGFYEALALFIFLSITDAVDGYIARRFKQETNLGIILDPVADKTLLLMALYAFTYRFYAIPPTLLSFLLLRDALILLGGLHMYVSKRFVPRSRPLGKITTAYICIAIPFIALFNIKPMLYVAYLLVFLSFLDYFANYLRVLSSKVEFTPHS